MCHWSEVLECYKGYIEVKGKKPAEPFKGRNDLRTLDEVRHLDGYAGVLAEGVVLIDVDDAGQAEKMLSALEAKGVGCPVIRTTRGMHFLFRNEGMFEKCGTHVRMACGLTADVKVGKHASYEVLKVGGAERELLRDCEVLQPAPKWLMPVKEAPDFLHMLGGDGRNQALFSYILILTSHAFTREEARECIRIINDHVLPEPLDADELEHILRDEAFDGLRDAFGGVGAKFMANAFGEYMIAEDHVCRINGQLSIWDGSRYRQGRSGRFVENAMLGHIEGLRSASRNEVMGYLEIMAPEKEPAPPNLVAFADNVLDLDTGELRDASPDDAIVNVIPWDYDPKAHDNALDKALNDFACEDPGIRALLEEVIGYCFYRRNEMQKFFVLVGDRANGKSTFLDVVKFTLGTENYSALDMSQLGERFSVAMAAGMLANIGDDISSEPMRGRTVSLLKKFTSGEAIMAEWKGRDPFKFESYAKQLFSANVIPAIRDETGAVARRMVVVPFNADFSDESCDIHMRSRLKTPEAARYAVRLGVEGLCRVIENGGFTMPEAVLRAGDDYRCKADMVESFLDEYPAGSLVGRTVREVLDEYRAFCREMGEKPKSGNMFGKSLREKTGLMTYTTTVGGKSAKVYCVA